MYNSIGYRYRQRKCQGKRPLCQIINLFIYLLIKGLQFIETKSHFLVILLLPLENWCFDVPSNETVAVEMQRDLGAIRWLQSGMEAHKASDLSHIQLFLYKSSRLSPKAHYFLLFFNLCFYSLVYFQAASLYACGFVSLANNDIKCIISFA